MSQWLSTSGLPETITHTRPWHTYTLASTPLFSFDKDSEVVQLSMDAWHANGFHVSNVLLLTSECWTLNAYITCHMTLLYGYTEKSKNLFRSLENEIWEGDIRKLYLGAKCLFDISWTLTSRQSRFLRLCIKWTDEREDDAERSRLEGRRDSEGLGGGESPTWRRFRRTAQTANNVDCKERNGDSTMKKKDWMSLRNANAESLRELVKHSSRTLRLPHLDLVPPWPVN